MSRLEYLTCDKLNVSKLRHSCYLCDDMSVTKLSEKTYSKCKDKCIKDHPCFGNIQLHYFKNDFFYVTTPPMKCLFGIQKSGSNFQMSLQFNNLKEDDTMKYFFDFIQGIEFKCMEKIGLLESDAENFISQIKYDKKKNSNFIFDFLKGLNYEHKNKVSELLNPINFFIWLVVSFKDIF